MRRRVRERPARRSATMDTSQLARTAADVAQGFAEAGYPAPSTQFAMRSGA